LGTAAEVSELTKSNSNVIDELTTRENLDTLMDASITPLSHDEIQDSARLLVQTRNEIRQKMEGRPKQLLVKICLKRQRNIRI